MYKQVKSTNRHDHNKIEKLIGYYFHRSNIHHYDNLLLEIDCLENTIIQVQETIVSKKSFPLFRNTSKKLAKIVESINILANLKQIISALQYSLINLRTKSLSNKESIFKISSVQIPR